MINGLYVHVPFCQTKCGYCDFYSRAPRDGEMGKMVQALLRELDRRAAKLPGPLSTIFVGGGTPTHLPLRELEVLFGRLGTFGRNHRLAEFTTEANPASLDEYKAEVLLDCGVNRISFGGQSFHQSELDFLERLHAPAEIHSSVRLAQQAGFERINLDLIFGIPGQTLGSWQDSLRQAVELGVNHLACYGLTYEPGTSLTTRLRAEKFTPCDQDLEADMYLYCIEFLAASGFEQYEISNFAQPGQECRHNLIYWNGGSYLGIGPSAASYLDGARFSNVSDIAGYIADVEADRDAWREEERLSAEEAAGEAAMLQLRLNQGIDVRTFRDRVGLDPLELFAAQLAGHRRNGWLEFSEESIRLTDSGRLVADRVIRDLLVDRTAPRTTLKVLGSAT